MNDTGPYYLTWTTICVWIILRSQLEKILCDLEPPSLVCLTYCASWSTFFSISVLEGLFIWKIILFAFVSTRGLTFEQIMRQEPPKLKWNYTFNCIFRSRFYKFQNCTLFLCKNRHSACMYVYSFRYKEIEVCKSHRIWHESAQYVYIYNCALTSTSFFRISALKCPWFLFSINCLSGQIWYVKFESDHVNDINFFARH